MGKLYKALTTSGSAFAVRAFSSTILFCSCSSMGGKTSAGKIIDVLDDFLGAVERNRQMIFQEFIV